MNNKLIIFIIAFVVIVLALCAIDFDKIIAPNENINGDINNEEEVPDNKENNTNNEEEVPDNKEDNMNNNEIEKNPVVTMEMENEKVVKIELYPNIAPETVNNFIYLINQGFYDGLIFHRLIPSFMAQGGDPLGDGTGGPGYGIKGEFSQNGVKNDLKHEIGVISMARSQDLNSAGSQFFIVTDENSYKSLDGLYAGFGKVIEGMDVVYEIVNTPVLRTELSITQVTTQEEYNQYIKEMKELNRPANPPVIKKMTVDTFGEIYAEPNKIEK